MTSKPLFAENSDLCAQENDIVRLRGYVEVPLNDVEYEDPIR